MKVLKSFIFSAFFILLNNLCHAQCNTNDYTALRAIYNSTGGGSWQNADGWQAMAPWPASPPLGCNICSLEGITCTSGRVTNIHLSNTDLFGIGADTVSGLTGSLPTEIGLLTELVTFNIGNNTNVQFAIPLLPANNVGGSIPTQIGNCTKLKNLTMNGNSLNNIIPATLFTLTDIEVINLSSNNLTGPLSSSVGNLTNLLNLSLGYNSSFGGGIPSTIGSLINLRFLNMEFCGLTGTIPSSMGSCTLLDQFIIRNNPNFTSTVPTSMNSMPNLTVFWGSNCDLNGTVPTFSGCPMMKRIHLSQNDFPGQSLPTSWASLSNLTFIGIGDSKIVGTIPVSYGNLPLITDFYINDNNITGTLPLQFTNWTQLKNFVVFNNPDLSGSLQSGYDAWTQVQRFRAHGCNFTGSVPTTYSNWADCRFFSIGGNNLSGAVPDIFGSMTNLFQVGLDSNSFIGSMPVSLASPDSLKELYIQECGLTGCFDPALNNLCNTLTTYNIDAGNSFDATWSNFCASGVGQCISITPTTCTFSNGLPVNHDVDGNACIHGMINISEAIHLTPQVNVPTSPEAGTMYFDATTAKLRVWDGAQWRECW